MMTQIPANASTLHDGAELKLAQAPTRGLVATRRALYASSHATLPEQLDLERDLQRELGTSADYREGISAFKQRRAPCFRGE